MMCSSFVGEEGTDGRCFIALKGEFSSPCMSVANIEYITESAPVDNIIIIARALSDFFALQEVLAFPLVKYIIILNSPIQDNFISNKLHCFYKSSPEEFKTYLDHLENSQRCAFIFQESICNDYPFFATWQRKISHFPEAHIYLNNIVDNYRFLRKQVDPSVKFMAVVKGIGSMLGIHWLAKILTREKVDYLGVAHINEGILLRRYGMKQDIVVLNPFSELNKCIDFDLEPEIYNFAILEKLLNFSLEKPLSVHIKVDTGMHRLGFLPDEIPKLIKILKKNTHKVKVKSVFTHLACADDGEEDDYSRLQIKKYEEITALIEKSLGTSFMRHAVNSAGTLRLKPYHYDMVRVGIALYGIDPTKEGHFRPELKNTMLLKAEVMQVKKIKKDSSIGYGRKGYADEDMQIAILGIGYVDGVRRSLSNGKGYFIIHGKKAPIIGNVCMDLTIVDATGIDVQAGDSGTIIGDFISPYDISAQLNTIPYETVTPIGCRTRQFYNL